eukprot:CAMPEP_0170176508 /NCGR_PEP_ID=MMETSP0040_2-20121228/9375_1 /TAXON_ID=641309 /ORGANISM="Lotharella oceanica, Strain CCMP622" /LENGTH=295 /DNA_ID=CAMNT_0010418857 /DNA_START=35 /DNA_END=922 /DNA_ORIENTATION=+
MPVVLTPEPKACPGSPPIATLHVLGFVDGVSMVSPPFMAEYVVTSPASGEFFAAYPSHATPAKARADFLYSVLTDKIRSTERQGVVMVDKDRYGVIYLPVGHLKNPRLLLGVFNKGCVLPWLGPFPTLVATSQQQQQQQQQRSISIVSPPTPKKKRKTKATADDHDGEDKKRKKIKMMTPMKKKKIYPHHAVVPGFGELGARLARIQTLPNEPAKQKVLKAECESLLSIANLLCYPGLKEQVLAVMHKAGLTSSISSSSSSSGRLPTGTTTATTTGASSSSISNSNSNKREGDDK